jgi:hypothetical protein
MTIAKLIEVLTALTSAGAVDEDIDVIVSIPDEILAGENEYNVIGVTVNDNGNVTLNGWEIEL